MAHPVDAQRPHVRPLAKPQAVDRHGDRARHRRDDQDVGERFRDCGPAGKSEQVVLALGAGDLDQVGQIEARRLRQDRARDRDVVVVGERAHDLARSVAHRSETARQFHARLGLDDGNQPAEDFVE